MCNGKNANKNFKMLKIFARDMDMYTKIYKNKEICWKAINLSYASKRHSKFANNSNLIYYLYSSENTI